MAPLDGIQSSFCQHPTTQNTRLRAFATNADPKRINLMFKMPSCKLSRHRRQSDIKEPSGQNVKCMRNHGIHTDVHKRSSVLSKCTFILEVWKNQILDIPMFVFFLLTCQSPLLGSVRGRGTVMFFMWKGAARPARRINNPRWSSASVSSAHSAGMVDVFPLRR